jgi:quercetin dioxygenase-like cupin family protein
MTAATASAAYLLEAGEAREHFRYGGVQLRYLARAADTDGRLTWFEATAEEAQSGPPLHIHHDSDEALLVLSGALVIQLGDERRELGPGGFAWMPHGIPHAFAIRAGGFRGLAMCTPGGIEHLFAAQQDYLDSLDGAAPDLARLAQIGASVGRVVGPPIALD